MSKYFSLFVFFLIFITEFDASSAIYREKTILVKFKSGSEIVRQWNNDKRIGEISQFKYIIGKNSSKGYISDYLLKGIENKQRNKNNTILQSSKISTLKNIAVIEYNSLIDPVIAAFKIGKMDQVEYAEPFYIDNISEIPNDPEYNIQYYVPAVKADTAWSLLNKDRVVLLGIVDTGIDYTHDELKNIIYENPGETGTDSNGNDKRTNGIDDDVNGFIDDWRGWDMGMNDNDPKPFNVHGTHVAGIAVAEANNNIGIAGTARQVKLLNVKIGPDADKNYLTNTYEGLLYAAMMGCDVINCSWGSTGESRSNQEILNAAVELGSLVVAAAGNDGNFIAFYPAAYQGVISVAAIDSGSIKAGFSNYDNTVDVSAPGVLIYSCAFENGYRIMQGTSMASPVAAAVACMIKNVKPELGAFELGEQLRATADNIDSLNPNFSGLIGRGRVNALRGMTEIDGKSIYISNRKIIDADGDGIFNAGDTLLVTMDIMSTLSDIKKPQVNLLSADSQLSPLTGSMDLPDFFKMQVYQMKIPFKVLINSANEFDKESVLELSLSGDDGNTKYIEKLRVIVNSSYATMSYNDLAVTFTNKGTIGFNDYPYNSQGKGILYKNMDNVIFEGGLLAGISSEKLSDCVRGNNTNYNNKDFVSANRFNIKTDSALGISIGTANFNDMYHDASSRLEIIQNVYQLKNKNCDGTVCIVYDVISKNSYYVDSLYLGLYFDFDIGNNTALNKVFLNNSDMCIAEYNEGPGKSQYCGLKLVTNQQLNFFAIDNDGSGEGNPGIYSGFPKSLKWLMMTGGIGRKESNLTDISGLISAGPIGIGNGDTARIAFVLGVNETKDLLESELNNIISNPYLKNIYTKQFKTFAQKKSKINIFTNPLSNNNLKFEIELIEDSNIELSIYDSDGKLIDNMNEFKGFKPKSRVFIEKNIALLSQGVYYLVLKTDNENITEVFTIIR